MKIIIEVKRERPSVTQGSAVIYINGEKIISFFDDIKLIKDGQKYYGENIGGWASTTPDSDFIKGLLYHPYDDCYHHKDKFLKKLTEEAGKC